MAKPSWHSDKYDRTVVDANDPRVTVMGEDGTPIPATRVFIDDEVLEPSGWDRAEDEPDGE